MNNKILVLTDKEKRKLVRRMENSENYTDVPVLDVNQMSADEDDLKRMAQEVYQAFRTIGFLAVVNHGIHDDLVRSHEVDWPRNNL